MTSTGTQLRKLIEAPEITVLPGVHDTLSGLVAQSCGAKAISAGGYAATASLLGRPECLICKFHLVPCFRTVDMINEPRCDDSVTKLF